MRSPLLQLLVLHVSSLYIYGNVVTAAGAKDNPPIYMCTTELTSRKGEKALRVDQYVSAELTKGCVVRDKYIMFDLEEMYKKRSKVKKDQYSVVISISEAEFINSHIKLINVHLIKDIEKAKPLMFTISDSNMSDTELDFGSENGNSENIFKLPPHSRISILRNKISITTKKSIFIFDALQLVNDCSIEIAHNVITTEHKGKSTMAVFYTRSGANTIVSDNSSFTLRDNEINMNGCCGNVIQYVWYQDMSSLVVTENSNYTWDSNNISMVVNGGASRYIHQYVWYTLSSVKEVLSNSQILIYSNSILMLAEKYTKIWSAVLKVDSKDKGTISGGSSVVWKDNCVAMGHKKTDKRNVFLGKWYITNDNSELLLDGNNFTITNEYDVRYNGWQTEFLWGNSKEDSSMTIDNTSKLNVANTQIHGNSPTGSMVVWSNQLYTKNSDVKQHYMVWSSSPAKDGNGSPIPTFDNSNIRQYMCVGIPDIPTPTVTVPLTTIVPPTKPDDGNNNTNTNTYYITKCKCATAMSSVLSTIPAILITSVVFLWLCN